MGLFDNNSKNDSGFWGTLYDLDGDGKTSPDEEILGYAIYKMYSEDLEREKKERFPDFPVDPYIWRQHCEDGTKWNVDPDDYESEEEFEEALEEAKHQWREDYTDDEDTGVSPYDYETEEEYEYAVDAAERSAREKMKAELIAKAKQKKKQLQIQAKTAAREAEQDTNVYSYCRVLVPGAVRPYSYLTGGIPLQVGDLVEVPVQDKGMTGTVVFVGQYSRKYAPFPVEKTKTILGKIEIPVE